MAHFVQCIIASCAGLRSLPLVTKSYTCAPLTQGFCAVPTDGALIDHIDELYPDARQPLPGFVHLRGGLVTLLEEISRATPAAYIETEYFGGVGTQSAAAYAHGRMVFALGDSDSAGPISQALRLIGVIKDRHRDEFEALGLTSHRNNGSFKHP